MRNTHRRVRAGSAGAPAGPFSYLPPLTSHFRTERGTILIIVLAVLSLLILIATTLSYTARLEEMSARNFADGIQARMAAETGVGSFFTLASAATTRTALLSPTSQSPGPTRAGFGMSRQPTHTAPTLLSYQTTRTTTLPGFSRRGVPGGIAEPTLYGNMFSISTGLARIRAIDECSKININKLGSWAEQQRPSLARNQRASGRASASGQTLNSLIAPEQPISLADAIYAVLSSSQVNLPGASREMSERMAYAILRYRYGPDGQPGRAGFDDDSDGQADEQDGSVDEPDEFEADPRLPANGDDRPFRRIGDLMRVEGMTAAAFRALSPYVTFFSASERRTGPERDAPAQTDLNSASAVSIYDRLRATFVSLAPETLAQFAANVVDYRDSDSTPTTIRLEGATDPILGVEVAPFVTEVFPGLAGASYYGLRAKYIEIFNPYDTEISLEGWALQVAGGAPIYLSGTLVPLGVIIVTDDYNGRVNPSLAASSFYGIFGMVPNGRNRLMVEAPAMQIPPTSSVVELRDAAGNLVDLFRYGDGARGTQRRSYQRPDPRIRFARLDYCTPFTLAGWSVAGDGVILPSTDAISPSTIKNAPFRNVLELFLIATIKPTATAPLADARGSENIPLADARGPENQTQPAVSWLLPTIGGGAGALNERLVDLFAVLPNNRVFLQRAGTLVGDSSTRSGGLFSQGASNLSAPTEYGRININSAPRPVLSALPGISDRQIDYLLYWRENTPRRDSLGGPIVFGRLSELLADNSFWTGQPQSVRLSVASRWIGAITFSSCAYTLTTENLPDPPSGPRLASRSKTQAIVSTDGGQDRVVSWRFAQ